MTNFYRLALSTLLILIFSASHLQAQEKQFPIIKDFGGIYEIENAVELPSKDKSYKIIIELVTSGKNPEEISRWIDNIARLINLHGMAGLSIENIKVKVVVHGGAVLDILSHEYYSATHKIERNPNMSLLTALQEAGVGIFVCGQSLLAREISLEELAPGVEVALSALITISKNVSDGYVLYKF